MIFQYLLKIELFYKNKQQERCFFLCLHLVSPHEWVIKDLSFEKS